jgi:hypothetical protein
MTGTVPQDAPSRLEEDKLAAPSSLNPAIPEGISDTIMSALSLNVSERIKTVGEFADLLGFTATPAAGNAVNTLSNSSPHTYVNPNTAPPLPTVGKSTAPVQLEVDIDFTDDDEGGSGENDEDMSESALRKKAREDKKKRKMIIVFSVIGGVVIIFGVALALALAGVFDRVECSCGTCTDCAPVVLCEGCDEPEDDCVCGTCAVCGELDEDCECEVHETDCDCVVCDPPAPGEERAVPNFTILNFAIAHNIQAELNRMYADVFTFTYEGVYCTAEGVTIPHGTIVEQSIAVGEFVPLGTEIAIKFSLGKEFITLPQPNAGESPLDYQRRLIEAGVGAENIRIGEPELLDDYVEGAEGTVKRVSPSTNVRVVAPVPEEEGKSVTIVTIVPALNPEKQTEPPDETTEEPSIVDDTYDDTDD